MCSTSTWLILPIYTYTYIYVSKNILKDKGNTEVDWNSKTEQFSKYNKDSNKKRKKKKEKIPKNYKKEDIK